jgi:glycosyltransferase involved in cell wall biosynthesis
MDKRHNFGSLLLPQRSGQHLGALPELGGVTARDGSLDAPRDISATASPNVSATADSEVPVPDMVAAQQRRAAGQHPGPHARILPGLDVALVHDYLNQCGGAERVALELSNLWPDAPIYTSLYRPAATLPGFRDRRIITSPVDRLPVDQGFRNLFPVYPAAFRALGEIEADVVISSSSGWAHMARTTPETLHVVYCHNPARWLYRPEHHLGTQGQQMRRWLVSRVKRRFARLDYEAAQHADIYLANSETVRQRILTVYGRDAEVVHPPVDTDRFTPRPRGERLLIASRLIPYKQVDLAVETATRLGIGLDVVGDGPLMPYLREIAGPTVALHGTVDDATVVELMESCRAVCVMGEEDFGMVAVEAQAAGKPVVAYGRGGSLETVEDGVTGVFFHELSDAALIAAISRADALPADPETVAAHSKRFSRDAFAVRLAGILSAALADRRA